MARKILKALIALGLCSPATAADEPKQTGPTALVIQYKCLPAQRPQLRAHMVETGLKNFAKWKAEGILADYRILFSRYLDNNSWDMLALLTFPDYSTVTRWKRVEASMPAGLQPDTLALTSSIETYPVDLTREASAPPSSSPPVYFVIPYTFSVSAPEYLKYADDYVRPQFDGWIQEGILAGYQFFLQRYTAARPWDTMIFLRYKDDESFGQREKVVAKVRAQLQSNPVWKAASDSKKNLRVEREAIIADELTGR